MQKINILLALSFILSARVLNAQEIPDKVAIEICNCVDTVENMDSLEARIDSCAQTALATVLESASEEVQEIYSTDEAVEETLNKTMQNLLGDCPKIRKLVVEDRRIKFYRRSDSPEANSCFDDANKLFEKEDYKAALKLYSRAFRKDPSFIYAIDNLALAYRKMGDLNNAIKYYNKSLSIYPEGSFALQNLAYAYTLNKDLQNALACYQKLAFFYPDNAEGYFGIGKLFVAVGDYENAIDYVFTAHRIYTAEKSEYAKESEQLIAVIYNKLREQNKLDLFRSKAKAFGIDYN